MVGLNTSDPSPRGPHKDDTVTMEDAQSGAWLLEPEQRPTFYRLRREGIEQAQAMRGARDLAYASELLRERQRSRTDFRPTEDAMAALNRKAEADYDYWANVPIPGEDKPSPSDSPQDASFAQRAVTEASRRIREVTGGKAAPSQQPKGRRERYLRKLVAEGKYPDMTTAERKVPHRKDATI